MRAADPAVSHLAARVLLDLVEYMDGQGVCWPARATLAGNVGVCERGVQRALAELLDHVHAPIRRRLRDSPHPPVYEATGRLRGAKKGDRAVSHRTQKRETGLSPTERPKRETDLSQGDKPVSLKTGQEGDRSVTNRETDLSRQGDRSVIAIRKNLSKNLSKEPLRARARARGRGRAAGVSDDDLDWTARTPAETWTLVAEALRALVPGRQLWATWVRPCAGLRAQAGRLEVAAPSKAHAAWLGDRKDLLREAAATAGLGDLAFTIVVRRVAA